MACTRKQWLTPAQQVQHLKSKGVRFVLISEVDAEAYLRENNNYFRLRSYRVGFPKHVGGPNDGKYSNLDFVMLVDLAIIDMHLRNELLPMTLDIEHFCKVRLLDAMEAHHEDGYQVVQDFISREDYIDQAGNHRNHVPDEISRGLTSRTRATSYSGTHRRLPSMGVPRGHPLRQVHPPLELLRQQIQRRRHAEGLLHTPEREGAA